MVTPQDITGALSTQWFTNLGEIGYWFGVVVISMGLIGVFYLVYIAIMHKIKITYYPIYGGDPEVLGSIREVKDIHQTGKDSPLELGQPKRARGRDMKQKGIRKFSIMQFPNVLKTHKVAPIEHSKRYFDGVWFLRPSKDVWIPIRRPEMKDTINIQVPEPDLDLWQESAEEEARRRTIDEGTMKKQLYMTVAIIIGAFALAGVIIWLSMTFAGNSLNNVLDKVGPMTNALNQLAEAGGPG